MSCQPNYNYENGRVKISDYNSDVQPNWCSGCGDYAIWAALKRSLVELDIATNEVLLCFDIGCNGNMSDKIRGYRIHSLHGRVLPLASAAKISNPKLRVIAFAGDGATYSEGINHFINTFRNNFPITFFVHDNGNYGLTTGQASATTPQAAPRTANPFGPTASTLNPLELAFSLNPSFVGRGFSGDINQLTGIMKEAISNQDKGFSYVNILQACPTYNKETTHDWYLQRVKDISTFENYDNTNLEMAKQVALDIQEKIATGILYKNNSQPTYLDRLEFRQNRNTTLVEEVQKQDISKYLQKFI